MNVKNLKMNAPINYKYKIVAASAINSTTIEIYR